MDMDMDMYMMPHGVMAARAHTHTRTHARTAEKKSLVTRHVAHGTWHMDMDMDSPCT